MDVRRRATLCLAAAALIACDAPTVPEATFAYDPRLPGGLVYHWPIGATISVYVDPAEWAPGDDPVEALRIAFEQWEEVALYRDFRLRITGDPADADVIMHHHEAQPLVDLSECVYPDAGASGVTFFCPTESLDGLVVLPLLSGGPGRVKMTVRIGFPRYMQPDAFQEYVSHEIGHVLGIGGHSDNPSDLLYGGLLEVAAPSDRDAQTLRWVLRQPPDIRP